MYWLYFYTLSTLQDIHCFILHCLSFCCPAAYSYYQIYHIKRTRYLGGSGAQSQQCCSAWNSTAHVAGMFLGKLPYLLQFRNSFINNRYQFIITSPRRLNSTSDSMPCTYRRIMEAGSGAELVISATDSWV